MCENIVNRVTLIQLGCNYYYVSPTPVASWFEAEQGCAKLGLHLARIDTSAESDALMQYLSDNGLFVVPGSAPFLWIALTDLANEGQFRWTKADAHGNTVLRFGAWAPLEPNNGGGTGQDCVAVGATGWQDFLCANSPDIANFRYICQVVDNCDCYFDAKNASAVAAAAAALEAANDTACYVPEYYGDYSSGDYHRKEDDDNALSLSSDQQNYDDSDDQKLIDDYKFKLMDTNTKYSLETEAVDIDNEKDTVDETT